MSEENRVALELIMDVAYIGKYTGDKVYRPETKWVGEYSRMLRSVGEDGKERELEMILHVDNATGDLLDSWIKE